MRAAVVATLALGLFHFAQADDASAAIKRITNIPAQPLESALEALSNQLNLQILYQSELVKDLKTGGAVGQLTVDQILTRVLSGTGLRYRYLQDDAITIEPAARRDLAGVRTMGAADDVGRNGDDTSVWNRFRLAEATELDVSKPNTSSSTPRTGDVATLSEVVVTAQKKEERLLDTPVPVSVISAATLTENNQVLLRDYASSVPGLNIQADIVNQQEVSIRGITTGGSGSAVVGIMVDGIPFGGSYNQTGEGFVPDFDPGDLQRVEVLRGPQGTLYGASSMGGLVNFVTVDPSTDRSSGRVSAGYSSVYNGAGPGYTVRASANIPVSNELALTVSGFSRQDPGYIDNPTLGRDGVNEAQADGARLAALWTPNEAISLKVSGLYQYYKQDAASDVVGAPGLGPWEQNYIAQYGGANWKRDQVYSAILNVKVAGITLTSATGYSTNKSYTTLDFGYVPLFGSGVQQMYGVTGAPYIEFDVPKRFTEEVRLAGSAGITEWTVGAYYSRERSFYSDAVYASNRVTGQIAGLYYPFDSSSRTGQEYAGFANATLHLTDQFDLQVGGRESRLSLDVPSYSVTGGYYGSTTAVTVGQSAANSVFTYSVTPEFKISPDLMVYAKAASGFRPGYGNAIGGTAIGPGVPRQVAPDKTKDYEVGAKGTFFDQTLTLDGSVYYIDWKNLQISLQSNDLLYHANGSAAKSEGVELSATVRPNRTLTIEGWIDYDNAVLTEPFPTTSTVPGDSGDRLPVTPAWSGYFSATQEFPVGATTGYVSADIRYVGERLGNFAAGPRAYYPEYKEGDVRGGVKVDGWQANLYINNVSNERGVIGGGTGYDPSNAFVYITPRTVGLNVSKLF